MKDRGTWLSDRLLLIWRTWQILEVAELNPRVNKPEERGGV